jgi:hypothetical protein
MTACGKWVSGYNTLDRNDPTKEHWVELRTSYPCSVDPEGHDGPCAAVEQPQTVSARSRWLEAQRRREADQRHAQGPLAEHQARPQTFAEAHGSEGNPHPSQGVSCPLCGGDVLYKDLAQHLRQSHGSMATVAAPYQAEVLTGIGTDTSRPTMEKIPTRANRKHDQPLPEPNARPVMHEVLIDLVGKRLAIGVERYGTGLQPLNGRDAYRDLVEELVDAAVYTLQIQHERAEMLFRAVNLAAWLEENSSDVPPQIIDHATALVDWLKIDA